jgi:hypothetical protein
MTRLLVVAALLVTSTGAVGQMETSNAGPGGAACPATTEAENEAVARPWHE